ncbi:hypothetical protein CA51_35160 [Rosistilla oblonga]|uniref:Trm112p-like protein n=1 Tax=Rosistilla oblonga TaxID=2527990 RepID=A0A518IYL3_9BACT|nr:Trm112 family protein [Rosistilla oblonga]QDV13625.1 hypothetical protein CA51_35160 [Rosistilla oblonga]QDV58183.1 hypothetical protein Mal33_42000 [Rosistilla oblonga]
MIDPSLFEYIRCPVTQSTLVVAADDLIQQINQRVAAGEARNRIDRPVQRPLDSGLVNADGTLIYPVWADIPTLIPDEAIPIAAATAGAETTETDASV